MEFRLRSISALMAAFTPRFLGLAFFLLASCVANAHLSTHFYRKSCPKLERIVGRIVKHAVARDVRLGARLLRLHFHDCFVNGCDGSLLLDDTPTFEGEKTALLNSGSIFGFEVIDDIKTHVEAVCPGIVSCADITALAALVGIQEVGGPSWRLGLGRRDARTASKSLAESDLPSPLSNLSTLILNFAKQGLDARDMTALSGAHTIGVARCFTFRERIYNDTNINSTFAATRQANCPITGGDANLATLDVQTPSLFDNLYYKNLVEERGLLNSDQVLFNGGSQDALVKRYSRSQKFFFGDFSSAMTKMSNISPLTGTKGEIRTNCRKVN